MNKKSTTAAFVILIAAITNLITILALTPLNIAINAAQDIQTASLAVHVCDALTQTPLKDATVCVLESDAYKSTDSLGNTDAFLLSMSDKNDYAVSKDFFEVTVLVYKQGYVDFLIFYVAAYKGKTRTISLTLFPDDGTMSTHILNETPPHDFCTELIEQYKK